MIDQRSLHASKTRNASTAGKVRVLGIYKVSLVIPRCTAISEVDVKRVVVGKIFICKLQVTYPLLSKPPPKQNLNFFVH